MASVISMVYAALCAVLIIVPCCVESVALHKQDSAARSLTWHEASLRGLDTERLRPDGSYPMKPDTPITFTFVPVAAERGRSLSKYRIVVWNTRGEEVADTGERPGPEPVATLSLQPGRFTWGVRWWSDQGDALPFLNSSVVVGVRDSAWEGVPWLGSRIGWGNEFFNEVDGIQGSAELMVAALGFGYVRVNGVPVSDDLLSPSGWTNTEKRVLFRTYDITKLLNSTGGGEIIVGLGHGYRGDSNSLLPAYQDDANKVASKNHDRIPMTFRLMLFSEGPDGQQSVLHSGSDGWLKRQGRVDKDSVYEGQREIVNEYIKPNPWHTVDPAMDMKDGPSGVMVPASFPGVRVTRIDEPVAVWRASPLVHVVDFGSNVAGVCELHVPAGSYGENGKVVSIRHAEILQHAGLPLTPGFPKNDPTRAYFENLRSAAGRDQIEIGSNAASWFPRFTYHGFRYVEVYDYPTNLTKDDIRRFVFHTAVEPKARANFSDEVFQQIHLGSVGSQRSNLMQVPTDCPARDERLGWLGDAGRSAASMMLHFHLTPMASAFVDNMVDALGVDGSLPDVVPFQKFGNRPGDPSWTAGFIEYLVVLANEGELTPAREHWKNVKLHLKNLESQLASVGGKLSKTPEAYGDWCSPPKVPGKKCPLKVTSKCLGTAGERPTRGFVAAFSIIRAFQQGAMLGRMLGDDQMRDASYYDAIAQNLTSSFHTTFWHDAAGAYDGGEMITYVLPLALGATPAALRPAVVEGLLKYIRDHNNTWTGGITNNRFLFDVLYENGHGDVALSMLQRKEYPSYGYMFFNGIEDCRECMWEIPDAPFQNNAMNSRNHHAFSSVGKYLIERIGGLVTRGVGGEVTAVAGAYPGQVSIDAELARGLVSFSWERLANGHVSCSLAVPVGMTAYVHLPVVEGSAPDEVAAYFIDEKENAAPLSASVSQALPFGIASVSRVELHGKPYNKVTVSSGRYRFATSRMVVGVGAA